MTTYHDRVQNAVVQLVKGLSFAPVTYPAGLRTTSGTANLKAKTVLCHRVSASFGKSQYGAAALGFGGCLSLPRSVMTSETWLLLVAFDHDVDLTDLEAAFGSTPLEVAIDGSSPSQGKLFVELGELAQRDPVEQQGGPGLTASYTLKVTWPLEKRQ